MLNRYRLNYNRRTGFGLAILPDDSDTCTPYNANYPACLGTDGTDTTRNGGGGTGGGTPITPQRTNAPSWAVGVFQAYLADGRPVILTILANGIAGALVDGHTYDGIISNGRLFLNGDWSDMIATANGIRTTNITRGGITEYTRATTQNVDDTVTGTGTPVANPSDPAGAASPLSNIGSVVAANPLIAAAGITGIVFLLMKRKKG